MATMLEPARDPQTGIAIRFVQQYDKEADERESMEDLKRRYEFYLRENIVSGKWDFTPQGIADCIDDAIGRAVYGSLTIR